MNAYEEGRKDLEDGNLEPTPPYEPGTVAYKQYTEGYMDAAHDMDENEMRQISWDM